MGNDHHFKLRDYKHLTVLSNKIKKSREVSGYGFCNWLTEICNRSVNWLTGRTDKTFFDNYDFYNYIFRTRCGTVCETRKNQLPYRKSVGVIAAAHPFCNIAVNQNFHFYVIQLVRVVNIQIQFVVSFIFIQYEVNTVLEKFRRVKS